MLHPAILQKANELDIAAILVECDFMDNYQSYRNFSDFDYLDMVAETIADNIINLIDQGGF